MIKLKVLEANEEYVGKGVVTLSTAIKQKLGLVSGDAVEINGARITVANVWPEKEITEEETIRMDQFIRQNAGVTIGEYVTINKINANIAKKIILSPNTEFTIFSANYDLIIKKALTGRVFREGDNIVVGVFGTSVIFTVHLLSLIHI